MAYRIESHWWFLVRLVPFYGSAIDAMLTDFIGDSSNFTKTSYSIPYKCGPGLHARFPSHYYYCIKTCIWRSIINVSHIHSDFAHTFTKWLQQHSLWCVRYYIYYNILNSRPHIPHCQVKWLRKLWRVFTSTFQSYDQIEKEQNILSLFIFSKPARTNPFCPVLSACERE